MNRIASEADIEAALDALCSADRRLHAVREEAGKVPLRLAPPGFASLVSIIIAQQVSRASADAIHGRFVRLLGEPEPEAVLSADEQVFRTAGVSRPKQKTLLAAAEAVAAGRLDLHGLCEAEPQEAVAAMTAVPGIGPWTAECYLLFAAGHPDIFPVGDIALQAAATEAFGLPSRPAGRPFAALAAPWSPHRSTAARLLWAYYGRQRGRDVMPVETSSQAEQKPNKMERQNPITRR